MPNNQQQNNNNNNQEEIPVPDPSELLKPLEGDLSYEVRKGSEPKDTDDKK
jgi:hypothetical protein